MLPVLAGLFAALCWGLSDFLVTGPTRALGQYRTTAYTMLFSSIVLFPFLAYTGINAFGIGIFALALLTSLISFLAFLFAYKAFRYGNLSITAPIVGTYPAVVVIGSVLVLGDTLTLMQFAAIITILAGIILTATKFSSLGSKRGIVAVGVGSALIAMVFMAIPAIFAGAYAAVVGFVLLSLMWRSVTSAGGFAAGLLTGQSISIPRRKHVIPLFGAGVSDALGILVFLYGIQAQSHALPIISALAGFAGAVSVMLALMMLKERPEKNQFVGIALAVAGVVLLSYFS